MAAAIILRQYEEMEEGGTETRGDGRQLPVSSLAITHKIIDSMISSPLARSSLATAVYWIAIRQEVYDALMRKRAPCVAFTPEDWANATVANIIIMHAGEVTKWCWGDRSLSEYERLKLHQQQLISDYSSHFLPILQKPANKSKCEIFLTVWYTTDSQVTGVQHLEESSTPRAAHRKAKAQVRSIVLNLRGIAVDNFSNRMPALVNAVISIILYGE
ncbi:hypothetical protein BDW59DRAFT_167235 [Aspergillus cavernicola]|uniref:Uncharacterized protein n=1 Tax=Aspergillus cavernicola TaxID=176166 RepID=A0ABR4HFV2_9EURO